MHSSMIGKIAKAKRYAQEKDRLQISDLTATFRGEHGSHSLTLSKGQWRCSCDFFHIAGYCSHTMATEDLLAKMVALQKEDSPARV